MQELKDKTYEERLKEIKLPTLEERGEIGALITIYKSTSDFEEINGKYLFLRVGRQAKYLRGQKKTEKNEDA